MVPLYQKQMWKHYFADGSCIFCLSSLYLFHARHISKLSMFDRVNHDEAACKEEEEKTEATDDERTPACRHFLKKHTDSSPRTL